MSDRVPPSGRDNRTIVRPNPGGKRQPPPGLAPAMPVDLRNKIPAPPPRPGGEGGEEWIASRAAAPPPLQDEPIVHVRAEELFAAHDNPLMRAAGPLLLMLGRLRTYLLRAQVASLMEQVAQSIRAFEKEIRQANVTAEAANTAKYILCATADDIVQNIPTEDRHVWTHYSMLSRFFGERIGGVRFFQIVEETQIDPFGNYDLLELQHACLALGFQGVHRTSPGGAVALQKIQRHIYELLRHVRARVATDLSPHWQGQALALRREGTRVPLWAVAALLAALLLALFLTLRYLLGGGAEVSAETMLALHPRQPITIARADPSSPPCVPLPASQLLRIRQALAPEINAGSVVVPDPAGPNWIVIDVGDKLLFASGEASVIPSFLPLARRMGDMLDHESGTIRIVGHTDNEPLAFTNPFKSNYDLSVARAKNVAEILKLGLAHPERLQVEGRGADQPFDPLRGNKTPEDQRKNRRVEVMVQQTDRPGEAVPRTCATK